MSEPLLLMPPEWAPHDRTWMGFPTDNYVGSSPEDSVQAWSAVANAIVEFEPLTMLVNPVDKPTAARVLDSRVTLQECLLDDSWMRDIGPTFVHQEDGSLGAVTWRFNGWGAQHWAKWENDSRVSAKIAGWSASQAFPSMLVNEGGGIAVDGAGTILLTETVQLDPGRNPDITKAEVEAEMSAKLGVGNFIWLERGLAGDYFDYGTRGHVDLMAAFFAPSACVAHLQTDSRHPDYDYTHQVVALLENRGVSVTTIDGPTGLEHDGRLIDWSYINFYVGNGFVLMPTFGDPPHDEAAAATLAELFPGRVVRTVDGRPLFQAGGGVHCITQQQPAAGGTSRG